MSTTNEISKQIGVSRRTLQYYDDQGLLSVKRDKNNHRVYDQKTLQEIWEILIYKEIGLELQEIKAIMGLSQEDRTYELQKHLRKLEKKIETYKIQEEFASILIHSGMPKPPDDSSPKSYVEHISEMREEIRQKISKDTPAKSTEENHRGNL